MPLNVPLLNGRAYDWASIKLTLFGKIVEGITAIEYGETQEKANNYGRGNKPVSRGRGNKEYSGTITLELKEVKAIEDAAGRGVSLTDIAPFGIEVSYVNENNLLITDRLRFVEFTNNQRSAQQGDATVNVEVGLVIGDVLFNV